MPYESPILDILLFSSDDNGASGGNNQNDCLARGGDQDL